MMLKLKRLLQALGPGFITAAVVLGPGSLTTSTKIGATQGYEFLWAIVIAGVSMAVYTGMSTRFAVVNKESILGIISQKFGKWLSIAIGISSFLATLSFQFGNNLGIGIATYVSSDIGNPVYSLIMAQASSILAVPLIAVGLILVLNRKDIMGKYRNNTFQNVLATLGFLLMCVLVYIMFTKLLTYFKIV